MVSVRFSGMFNMVQEFGTAVYGIAKFSCDRNEIEAFDFRSETKSEMFQTEIEDADQFNSCSYTVDIQCEKKFTNIHILHMVHMQLL